jgi:ribosomal protein L22
MSEDTPKDAETETPEVEAVAEGEAPAEEPKPKRRTRARKAKAKAEPVAEADAPAAEEAASDDDASEEADAEEAVAEAEDGEAKPRRRRRSRAAADEPAEPAPAPARTRQRPAGERVLVRAQAKYVRTSARKARLVCDHIRGKSVQEARAILALTPRAVSRDWSKLLESAVANAENNHELLGDDLRIASVTADEGPTLKRFRPRAMGRATRIRKRTSHLTILLTPKES